MKKVISFSLYGKNPKYLVGAVRNTELQKEIFPDWTCRFYVTRDVPGNIVRQLENNGAEVLAVKKNNVPTVTLTSQRFLAAVSEDVDVCLIRDTDDRLNRRQKNMVDQWLESGKGWHMIRDYPPHVQPIMGGSWGVRKGRIRLDMQKLIQRRAWLYVNDQDFLWDNIHPLIGDGDMLVHSNFTRYPGETVIHVPFTFTGNPKDCDFAMRTWSADDVPCKHLTAEDVAFRLPENGAATHQFPRPVRFTISHLWRRVLVKLWFLFPHSLRKPFARLIPEKLLHGIAYGLTDKTSMARAVPKRLHNDAA